jgi:quercetin dioxygenase-like cupin family protein
MAKYQLNSLAFVAAAVAAVGMMLLLLAAASTVTVVMAADADPIDDFCVADLTSPIILNGLVCVNPATVNGSTFAFTGFENAGNTSSNGLGSAVTPGFAGVNYPALNTQGLALARLDYAPGGLVPPHTHPRATEVLYLVKGQLLVGFVDTNDKFYPAHIKTGDVYVFPRGLVHFQFNFGTTPAFAIAVLNSQNPGVQLIAPALFGATPPIEDTVLAKAFGIPASEVEIIKKGFGA